MKFDALVSDTDRDDKLEIRWVEYVHPRVIASLANKLDNSHGVEKVYPHRYSLEVFFAPHVLTKASMAEIIQREIGNIQRNTSI